jgi:hypothetical protein
MGTLRGTTGGLLRVRGCDARPWLGDTAGPNGPGTGAAVVTILRNLFSCDPATRPARIACTRHLRNDSLTRPARQFAAHAARRSPRRFCCVDSHVITLYTHRSTERRIPTRAVLQNLIFATSKQLTRSGAGSRMRRPLMALVIFSIATTVICTGARARLRATAASHGRLAGNRSQEQRGRCAWLSPYA